MEDVYKLTDAELIELYNKTDPDSPDIDRLANEIERRGLDI